MKIIKIGIEVFIGAEFQLIGSELIFNCMELNVVCVMDDQGGIVVRSECDSGSIIFGFRCEG